MRWTSRCLHRPFAALIAVLFALVLVEPAALHSCPVHGDHALPSGAIAGLAADDDVASGAVHAEHHAGDQVPGDGHAGCTCPDDCATAGAGIVVPEAHAIASAPDIIVATTIDAPVSRPSDLRIAFRIPFANGPPALSSPA